MLNMISAIGGSLGNIIGAIWGFLNNVPGVTVRMYNYYRRQAIHRLVVVILASLVCVLLNYVSQLDVPGFSCIKYFNIVLAYIFIVIYLLVFTSPIVSLTLLGSRIVLSESHQKNINNIVRGIALYTILFFLLVGTFNFGGSFWTVPVLYLLIAALILAQYQWGYKARFFKPFAYGMVIVMIIVNIGSLIPTSAWKRVIGFDLYAWNRITRADVLVDKIQKQVEENQELAREARLEKLLKEAKAKTLTPETLNCDDDVKVTKGKSFPSRVKSISSLILSAGKPVNQPIQSSSRVYNPGTYHFSLKAGEETPWMTFTSCVKYDITSADNNFYIVYADGERVHGSVATAPHKVNLKYKLVAVSDQTDIKMNISKI